MREITAEWVGKAENDFEVAQLASRRAEEPISDELADDALVSATRVRSFIRRKLLFD